MAVASGLWSYETKKESVITDTEIKTNLRTIIHPPTFNRKRQSPIFKHLGASRLPRRIGIVPYLPPYPRSLDLRLSVVLTQPKA
jgi:hypothetical protein